MIKALHILDSMDLENLNRNIKAIKIDTEGEDLKVLLGGQKLIEKNRPQIFVEVREDNKQEIQMFFKDLNYSIHNFSNIDKDIDLKNLKIKNVINIYARPT